MKKLILFATIFLAFTVSVYSQTVTLESARAAFAAKNYEKAADEFKDLTKQPKYKSDASVWNYLGLAYKYTDESEDSVRAFKKAVSLEPKNLIFRYNYATLLSEKRSSKALGEIEKILASDPNNKDAISLRGITYVRLGKYDKAKADAERMVANSPKEIEGYLAALIIRQQEINGRIIEGHSTARKQIDRLREVVDLMGKGSKLCGGCKDQAAFDYQLGIAREVLKYVEKPDDPDDKITVVPDAAKNDDDDKDDKRLRIKSKPLAQYTDTARDKGISGTVGVIVTFGASGKIEGILLKHSLGGGLDEQAMAAASQIKFKPLVKDGKPTTTVRLVEYTFTIY